MGGQGESKILVLGLGCTENTNLPIRRRIVVMLMLLLLCMVLVYAIVVVKLGDQGYILAGLVLMVCVVTTLLVPLRLAERRREQQMPYEQIPQHIFAAGGQQRQGSDYLLGVNLRHLRLILREGDFDANDYDELLRLDEGTRIQNGLHQSQIDRFPRHVYAEKESKGKKCPVCAICLENLVAGDELRTIPCMHSFHVHCIDKWLKSKPSCPVCMFSVLQGAQEIPHLQDEKNVSISSV
ncbi:hypothetical protein AAMO2058_001338000 [Amorphochlora amoebiformis]